MRTPVLLLVGLLSVAAVGWAQEKRELLARHETLAEFTGLQFHRCRGLTSLCPNQCGHSGNLATFRIIKYLAYEKPGQYGDPQQEQFQVLIENNLGQSQLPAAQAETLKNLKPGQYVRLAWRHDYVTNNGGSSPERPLTRIEKLTPEQAAKLAGDTPLQAPKAPQTPAAVPIQPLAY